MKELADEIHIVSDINRVRAMFERNHALVDNCGILLGLYPDDTWHRSKGGMAECLRYALSCRKKRPIDIFQLKYVVHASGIQLTGIARIA